jgi:hypothetical protein
MGRPVKLSDQSKEWFRRCQCNRKRPLKIRAERQRFLIVCEGTKTEPNYFETFKNELPPHVIQLEICGTGANTLSLVSRAQDIMNERANGDYPFDQVWIVFDRDSFDADSFDNAIHKADSSGMSCAWSNEAFELWYILHFEYRNTAMDRAEYQGRLTSLLGAPYRKNAPDVYQKLSQFGNQSQATAWAKALHDGIIESQTPPSRANPCTTVFKLVHELNQFKPKEA